MTGRPRAHEMALTAQQLQVLTLIARGDDMPAISKRLDITVNTARGYLRQLLERLVAANQAHAVAIAIGLGILPPDVATNIPGR